MKNIFIKAIILSLVVLLSISVEAEEDYSWLIGRWTDGEDVITIVDDNKITIHRNEVLIKEGTYSIEGYLVGLNCILTNWGGEYPIYEHEKCIGGGDDVFYVKLPDNKEFDFSDGLNINIFLEEAKIYWKNVLWAYGEWEISENCRFEENYIVKITPFFYQEKRDGISQLRDFSDVPKKWYITKTGTNTILGNVVYIDNLYLDVAEKRIYRVYGVEGKVYYMNKIAEYKSTLLVVCVVVGIIVLFGVLFALFFLGKKIILHIKFLANYILMKKKLFTEECNNVKEHQVQTIEKSNELKLVLFSLGRKITSYIKSFSNYILMKKEYFAEECNKTEGLKLQTLEKSNEFNLSRNSINFCPSCGCKLEGALKFCPNCGKLLKDRTVSESTFSKLGNGIVNIYSKASSTAQDVAGNIKNNLDEREAKSKRTVSVLSVKYDDASEEKIIGQCDVMLGSGLLKEQGSVVVTNKALLLYKNCGPLKVFNDKIQTLGNKIGLSTNNMLDHKISLKDIVRISRTQSAIDKRYTIYSIETKSATHLLCFFESPYLFRQYMSKVLKFDTSIYNINLQQGEYVKYITCAIVESANGTNYGTLYITNKRIAFTKIVGSKIGVKFLSNRMYSEEGTELLFSIELYRLANIISEQKSWTDCEYHINEGGADYIIKFNKRVPKVFLALVPNAEGNEDILRRKAKIKKGFKVAMLLASFVGLGSIADAAKDVDVDVDDMDMDSAEIDLDGDGDIDAIGLDSDGDGKIDAISTDCDNDGTFDSLAVDKNGDGVIDQVAYDTNGDGAFDQIEMDTNGDGIIDTAGIDSNGDGVIDTVTASNGASDGIAHGGSGDSMMDNYYDSQRRVMELDRQIMNTANPMQREALIRERDFLASQAPSAADIIYKRMHG